MVYRGPSQGCNSCRVRRVRCDEGRPFCGACTKRKQQRTCTYRYESPDHRSTGGTFSEDGQDIVFLKIETPETYAPIVKPYQFTSPEQVIPALSDDRELESLCFYFTNYVDIPRDRRSDIFVQHLSPLYKQAPVGSPLRPAVAAAAITITEIWRTRGLDSELSQRAYSNAVTSLRRSCSDPQYLDNLDFLLASIFMIDFCDIVSRRFKQSPDMDFHIKAGMALLRERGKQGKLTRYSRRIYCALRNRYIQYSLRARKKVDLATDVLLTDEDKTLPSLRLDSILARLANALHDSQTLAGVNVAQDPWYACTGIGTATDDLTCEILLDRCLRINESLEEWQESLPESWRPIRHAQPFSIHHTIRDSGLYNGLCDVYTDATVANYQNSWRSNKILVLRLIKHCFQHLPLSPNPSDNIICTQADEEIQLLVDGICASVPFILGSRISRTLPHEEANYPPVPSSLRKMTDYVDSYGQSVAMTDREHARSAAATGGWFLLLPLAAILSYASPVNEETRGVYGTEIPLTQQLDTVKLRLGQLEWIYMQVVRIKKVYLIP